MAIREKVWDCSDCRTSGILGRHKDCPNCGSPREKGEMRSMTSVGGPTVTDPALLVLAKAGPDWFCTHCAAGNQGDGARCVKCGAPRYGEKEENHPNFSTAHVQAPVEKVPSYEPPAHEYEPPPQAPPSPARTPRPIIQAPIDDEPEPPMSSYRSGPSLPVFLGGGLFAALVIGFFWWAFSTHQVPGAVSGMTWTREAHTEHWTQVTTRLWKHQTSERAEIPPSNGAGGQAGIVFDGGCRSEQFDTERYVCGSHEVCRDVMRTEQETYSCTKSESYTCGETCRDLGNGFEDCNPNTCYRDVPDTCTRSREVFDREECHDETDTCTRPIMKDRCDYHTQEWQAGRTYSASGRGTSFSWPTVPSDPLGRVTYSGTYRVSATYQDGDTMSSIDVVDVTVRRRSKSSVEAAGQEYSSWRIGEAVRVDVTNLGTASFAGRGQ